MSADMPVFDGAIPVDAPDVRERFLAAMDQDGFALVTGCYTPVELVLMKQALLDVEARERAGDPAFIRQEGKLWAIWNLYEHSPALMRLAISHRALGLMHSYFRQDVHFCRGTLMKKTTLGRQSINWHQDRRGAVDHDQSDAESVGLRAGVPHRSLSVDTNQRHYLIARIHLEHQYEDGGALMVVPGSSKLGVLEVKDLHAAATQRRQVLVAAPEGSVLFALPLTLHASGPNTRTDPANHRRVLHNEFRSASSKPCEGFDWYPWKHGAVIKGDSVEFFGN